MTEKEISSRTRRSFLVGGIAAVAGFGAWEWIRKSAPVEGVQGSLRHAEELDDKFSHVLFSGSRLAKTFDASEIGEAQVNGDEGLDGEPDPNWKLIVEGEKPVTIEQIRALPKVEQITQFKCIEGWNYIMKWGGAKFSDFVAAHGPAGGTEKPWVALETPDAGYYVGLDRASAMHPQTLLCYEMNGEPLSNDHGAPLRLVIPVKYGIKNIKRIGRIDYTDQRPADFWAERGYDYFSGL